MNNTQKRIAALSVSLALSSSLAYNVYLSNKNKADQDTIMVLTKNRDDIQTTLLEERESSLEIFKEQQDLAASLKEQLDSLSSLVNHDVDLVPQDMTIECTAYNLDEALRNKWHGMTKAGINVLDTDKRIVAVDPSVIPLKRYIYVIFSDAEYQKYNGWWYTGDTGNAVKGNVVDFYLGEETPDKIKVTDNFGRRKATVIAMANAK